MSYAAEMKICRTRDELVHAAIHLVSARQWADLHEGDGSAGWSVDWAMETLDEMAAKHVQSLSDAERDS